MSTHFKTVVKLHDQENYYCTLILSKTVNKNRLYSISSEESVKPKRLKKLSVAKGALTKQETSQEGSVSFSCYYISSLPNKRFTRVY